MGANQTIMPHRTRNHRPMNVSVNKALNVITTNYKENITRNLPLILDLGYTLVYRANLPLKAETANWPYMGLQFELQTSRSVNPNRNEEPDQMAATRASGGA